MNEIINEALNFAAVAHTGQFRKINHLPYILHPVEVATIVAGITSDADVIIAALLHDTIEDTSVTEDEVREKFGERVLFLVSSETENKRPDLPKEQTWRIRKEESLEELKNAEDIGVKILWLADKVANMRSLYRGFKADGDKVFDAFHQKDKKQHEWYYRTIAEYTKELSDTAAYEEYIGLIEKVYN